METSLATHPMVRPRKRLKAEATETPNYIFVSSDGKSGWHYWNEGEDKQPRFRAIENFNIEHVGSSYSIIRMADLVPLLPV
jgi:hypothetical protein